MAATQRNPDRKKIVVLRSATDLETNRTGGAKYQKIVLDVLSEYYDIEVKYVYYKEILKDNPIKKIIRLARMVWILRFYNFRAQLYFLDRRTMFLIRRRPNAKYVGLVHHHDAREGHGILTRALIVFSTYIGVPKVDVLVTVSKYWKQRFSELGAKHTEVIYNPFDVEAIDNIEQGDFLVRHNIPTDKPIIYIGMDSPDKGAVDVYEALKDQGYLLVTSGAKRTNIQTLNLDLPYDDYLRLLATATLSINLSKIPEGWSRVTHESMLMRTPVIGSGVAGMRELLEDGRQIICTSAPELPELVRGLLTNSKKMQQMSADGRAYAETFTIQKFKEDWLAVVDRTVSGGH
jgi:glycosyltransferase involved in cell wall biosynthesis